MQTLKFNLQNGVSTIYYLKTFKVLGNPVLYVNDSGFELKCPTN